NSQYTPTGHDDNLNHSHHGAAWEPRMPLSEMYRQMCALPLDRYVVISDAIPPLATIRRGVVFVKASWSVASQVAFGVLNSALVRLNDAADLRILVIDTDDAV